MITDYIIKLTRLSIKKIAKVLMIIYPPVYVLTRYSTLILTLRATLKKIITSTLNSSSLNCLMTSSKDSLDSKSMLMTKL
jgi:hypothetical protein